MASTQGNKFVRLAQLDRFLTNLKKLFCTQKRAEEIATAVTDNKTAQDATNEELKSQISTVSQKSDKADTELNERAATIEDTAASNKSELEGKISALESTVASNKSEQAKNTSDGISAVETNLNKAPSESPYNSITKLNERAATIEDTAASNKSAISSVKQTADETSAAVKERANDIRLVLDSKDLGMNAIVNN